MLMSVKIWRYRAIIIITIIIYLVNSRASSSISCSQIDSILKEHVKIFADCKLMILCLSF